VQITIDCYQQFRIAPEEPDLYSIRSTQISQAPEERLMNDYMSLLWSLRNLGERVLETSRASGAQDR
jgi:hypothetical protein